MLSFFRLFFLGLTLLGLFIFFYSPLRQINSYDQAITTISRDPSVSQEKPKVRIGGNERIVNFNVAKKFLNKIYEKNPVTFYCGCKFNKYHMVDRTSCAYTPVHENERSERIEWEHIVPAHALGKRIPEWQTGDSHCVDKKGKRFRGRTCLRKVSYLFNLMEGDLYNLVPAVGELNERRSNLPFGEIGDPSLSWYAHCNLRFAKNKVEPSPDLKGFIARTYLYINAAYPQILLLSKREESLFQSWDKDFPPKEEEKRRAQLIESIQGNKNPYVFPGLAK